MKRVNVRCCCTPHKILGTLPWDEKSSVLRAWIPNQLATQPCDRFSAMIELSIDKYAEIPIIGDDDEPSAAQLELMAKCRHEEMAFKAEGVSLEMLRMIPGFIEHTGDSP